MTNICLALATRPIGFVSKGHISIHLGLYVKGHHTDSTLLLGLYIEANLAPMRWGLYANDRYLSL